jgi:SsrA-binding protein
MRSIAENRDAQRKYHILETLEAGIVLSGHEVKSARRGAVSLRGAFVVLKGDEPYLVNAHIGSFQPKNAPADYEPTQSRKLLLHAREIKRILGKRAGEGLTLVPLRLYTSRGKLKVAVGIARSKSKADQRETLKKKDAEREMRRALRGK